MNYFNELSPAVKIFIGILFVGMIFKIQKWPFATEIIVSSTALIAVFYCIQFLNKLNKTVFDYLKVIGVVLACTFWIFKILHLPFQLPILIAATIIYIVVFIFQPDKQDESQEVE